MDRLIIRNDTRENWEKLNPTLYKGELGIVIDNPNLFKVGNGVNKWNDLSYRGYTGSVAQTTGEDANATMSLKAITEALSEIEKESSAYLIAVKHGFVGTEELWLESLKGVDGTDGSAVFQDLTALLRLALVNRVFLTEALYERKLEEGTLLSGVIYCTYESDEPSAEGTEIDPDAVNLVQNGKSAYQIAVDKGFVGTEELWVISLSKEAKDAAEEISEQLDRLQTLKSDYATTFANLRQTVDDILTRIENTDTNVTSSIEAANAATTAATNAVSTVTSTLGSLTDLLTLVNNAAVAANNAAERCETLLSKLESFELSTLISRVENLEETIANMYNFDSTSGELNVIIPEST